MKITKKKYVPRTKKRTEKLKYSKENINYGYDLLENLGAVRYFYKKNYGIDLQLLELLLCLYPKKFFTQDEYFHIPKQFTFARTKKLIEMDILILFSKATSQKNSVFALSAKGKKLIENFYKYLSGEKKMLLRADRNKVALKTNSTAINNQRMKFIETINNAQQSEHKKALYI